MMVDSGCTKKMKEKLLKELNKNNGLVMTACKEAEVGTSTYYDWMQKDPEFAARANDVKEFILDKVETVLHDKLHTDTACLLFYMKCQGKKRGYIEKQQIEHSTGDLSSLREAMSEVTSEHEEEY